MKSTKPIFFDLSSSLFCSVIIAGLIYLLFRFFILCANEDFFQILQRYLNNKLCHLILFVFISITVYYIFQFIGIMNDKIIFTIIKNNNKLSIFQKFFFIFSGRIISEHNQIEKNEKMNQVNSSENKVYDNNRLTKTIALITSQQRKDEILAPLFFGIWVLPILGFIGTVIGITDAIKGLEPLMNTQGAEISMQGTMGDVISGLKFAFDTTLMGLVCVIPTMIMSISLRIQLSRFDQVCTDYLISENDNKEIG